MTLKINRAPLLCCVKLCASFPSHRWVQTKVRVWRRSIRVKIGNLLSLVTLKLDGWPRKTIGHLFYAASSFMHHFIAISEFKLKLQSGNTQFGSKSAIFLCRVTLKFDGWPLKTIGHLFNATSSFVHHFVAAIGELKLELQSRIAQFEWKSTIFLAMWPWSLTDDLEKQYSNSPKQHQQHYGSVIPHDWYEIWKIRRATNCDSFLRKLTSKAWKN